MATYKAKKGDYMKDIVEILISNGISKFYHLTKLENWDSGKSTNIKQAGLYSRKYLEDNNIITEFSSNNLSYSLR